MTDAAWREKIKRAFAEGGETLTDEEAGVVLCAFRRLARLSLNSAFRTTDAETSAADVARLHH